ncbi:MAG: HD domain-containing phosphohydrolase [Phycisphaeraceae bacterium]
MEAAVKPSNESERLSALRSYDLLDTQATRGFDDIVELTAHLFDVPIALVSLVDDDRQWFKAKCGLDACQTPRDISFCGHAILQSGVFVVEDALTDHRFFDNPLVTGEPYVRFYAGAPLVDRDGFLLGTLCINDTKPRGLSDRDCELLQKLAAQVIDQAELHTHAKDARKYYDQVIQHTGILEEEVDKRTQDVVRTREQVIQCLARAAEYRDDDTGNHIRRVSQYVGLIANELGLPEDRCNNLELASTLHDIGKIGIPDALLLKPGKLTEHEFGLIKGHASFGSDILNNMSENDQSIVSRHCEIGSSILGGADFPLLVLAEEIARTHHEKFDGTGYPHRIKGHDIPLSGRITAVADVFDALSSERPYKEAFPLERCLEILEEGRGSHFDPDILDAFLARLDEVMLICNKNQDQCSEEKTEHAA